MKYSISTLLVIILLSTTLSTAFPGGWTDDLRISSTNDQSRLPRLAIDSHNNIHIAWYDGQNDNYEIYYTKLNASGIPINQKRITDAPQDSVHPDIAIDKKDNIHLVWADFREGDGNLYYKKLDNDGNALIDDKKISTTLNVKIPKIVVDKDNNLHIVWADFRNWNWEIYYKKIDSNGEVLIDDTRLTNAAETSDLPSIALDAKDNLHIVWEEDRDGKYNYEIYYTKLDNNGTTLIDDTRITFANSARNPSIAVDKNDNVHIAWNDNREGGYAIYYTKLDNNGNTLIDDTKLTPTPGRSFLPQLAVDSFNHLHVIWQDHRQSNYEIYHVILNANGDKIKADERLTFNDAHSKYPSFIIDKRNNLHVAWRDDREGNKEIYYKNSMNIQKDNF